MGMPLAQAVSRLFALRPSLAPTVPDRAVLLGAEADVPPEGPPQASPPIHAWLDCQTHDKPAFDRLAAAGFKLVNDVPEAGYALTLCYLGKHKQAALAQAAQGWAATAPEGWFVAVAANAVGAASLMRALKETLGEGEEFSKGHARLFCKQKNQGIVCDEARLQAWNAAVRLRLVPETGFYAAPGLYSWNKIDRGSAMLAAHMPGRIGGRVADLGAGWGYLSVAALGLAKMDTLALYEANIVALEAARLNLAPWLASSRPDISFHWADATVEPLRRSYDSVIMNPPFHQGARTDATLGLAFIAAAAAAIKPGGSLLMTANRHLPYEGALRRLFRSCQLLQDADGFKVLHARL
jgi:16S rRNA (guanine1207-N2)-methyltransferase